MSDVDPAGAAGALSFERAEFESQATPSLACAFCRRPMHEQYWQINKRVACGDCQKQVEREIETSMSRGRFLNALQYGVLAAAAGSVGWIVISKLTGSPIGIVAIGVGYLVGKAVRKGGGGFGARRYQVLALFLTYSAIALASLPAVFEALRQTPHPATASAAPDIGAVLWSWTGTLGFALASPFLGGARNFMGLIIIAIGLYQAWKLTRPLPVQMLGPFATEPGPPAELPRAPTPDAAD